MKRRPTVTQDQLTAALQAAQVAMGVREILSSRPAGAFTVQEFCQQFGYGRTTAYEKLRRAEAAGKLERLVAYHLDIRGHRIATNFYRPKSA